MSISVKVSCPVCHESLEYQHEQGKAYGMIPLEDIGCAEITINDTSGQINAHMDVHRTDGTWLAAFERRLWHQMERASKYFGDKGQK